jgi:hypothetical protein
MPTTLDECRALRAWANAQPVTRTPAATQDQIERHLEFIAATLPSRAIDDESGKRRFAVYVSLLTGHTNEALARMARRACETLDWFPTPKQCLELAGEMPRPGNSAAAQAIRDCEQFTHDRFNRWIAELPEADEIGDVPQRWIDIAIARNLIRRQPDKSLIIRRKIAA